MPEARTTISKSRVALAVVALGLAGAAGYSIRHPRAVAALPAASGAPAPSVRPVDSAPPPTQAQEDVDDGEGSVRPLKMPNGLPAMLDCRAARRVIAQVHARIAEPVGTPKAATVADGMIGWLDPHGLWSAAPDAPTAAVVRRVAPALLAEIERGPRDGSPCAAAREIGRTVQQWVAKLRPAFDAAASHAPMLTRPRALALASEAVFQDDPVTRPARELSMLLGERAGAFEKAFDKSGQQTFRAAGDRLLPLMSVDQWTGAVLAATVRAYVPALDAHGQWAPLDEEWSLYAADAAMDPGPRLWGQMMRTPIGVRVLEDPAPPLRVGDVVLSVGGIATAGLSVEQVEQLAQLEAVGAETSRSVTVVRASSARVERVEIPLPPTSDDAPEIELATQRIPYGDGDVLVVTIPDVPDGLGDELSQIVADNATQDPPVGILLDLRGNGGGSTDGAAGAIGVFLPGAPSFPYRHRGGAIEIQRALAPAPSGVWHGPVASLVDGYTASAAEMIAGALESYGRGTVVGTRTFGKGCIQEYFDDRPGVGVLRLTTMLYALPDGSPVQHVGVAPALPLPIAPAHDHEAALVGSLGAWRGPDVRDHKQVGGPAWPSTRGRVGPCKESVTCLALRRLGAAPATAARHTGSQTRAPRRGTSAP